MAASPVSNGGDATPPMLRLLVCGSVDDGKSTLIGRLLLDTDQVPEDQVEALAVDSRVHGTTGGGIDPALLTDGLSAEREQGITIDVAWRQLQTPQRRILIADTPGHIQHTRNMATGASGCRAAVVLVDASQGVLEQTRRHTAIVALMGIRDVVFAVNKVDLVDFNQELIEKVGDDCRALAVELGIDERRVFVVPVVARDGDNVVERSTRMDWWEGPTLLETLVSLGASSDERETQPLRFPIQLVVRPDATFRGYAGTVMAGTLRRGEAVRAVPSGVRTVVARLLTFDGDLEHAIAGTPVTVVLADHIDLARGDLLVRADSSDEDEPLRSHRVDATLIWLDPAPHTTDQRLLLRSHTGVSGARVARVAHALDIGTLEPRPAAGIALNDVVRVELEVDREHVFDPYERIPATGAFVLIDRASQAVVAAGLAHGVPSPFDREVQGQLEVRPSRIDATERAARLGHRPATLLITGMSGTGKTTLALALEERLFALGATVVRLDGEALRLGLSRGLGFGPLEREENLRRAAETARLLNEHGQIVLIAAQAPAIDVRARMVGLIGEERSLEIHLHAPDELLRRRDPSGAHAAIKRGTANASDLHGIASGYEPPLDPDLAFDTASTSVEESVDVVIEMLRRRGFLSERRSPSNQSGAVTPRDIGDSHDS
jgi:bifunctional enzyme CysN/CysC